LPANAREFSAFSWQHVHESSRWWEKNSCGNNVVRKGENVKGVEVKLGSRCREGGIHEESPFPLVVAGKSGFLDK
jgi:hypothetical protein